MGIRILKYIILIFLKYMTNNVFAVNRDLFEALKVY